MLKDPNLIKRPLIIRDNKAYQGFDEKSLLDFVTVQAALAKAEMPLQPETNEQV